MKTRNTFNNTKKNNPAILDIQIASEGDLEKLPCIGESLSARIIKYRNSLGGYYKLDQIKEVYGIIDSCFHKIATNLSCSGNVVKINLNSISKTQLEKHPYFRKPISQIIFSYLDQHDSIKDLNQLREIYSLEKDWIEKVTPYLEFER